MKTFEQTPIYIFQAGTTQTGTDGTFLALACVVDDYQTLSFKHGWYSPGTFTIVINKNTLYASQFQTERIIRIGEDKYKCGTITSIQNNIGPSGAISETLTITGHELPGWLDLRLTYPLAGSDYYTLSAATPVETVIKSVISYNMGPTASTGRPDTTMTIATDIARGGNYLLSTRYANLLSVVSDAALAMDVGVFAYLDIANKKWILDVGIGLDRTVGQSTNPRAVFSTDRETIKEAQYTKSISNLKTVAITAGQGEGADRVIRIIPATPATGRQRRELFVDARDLSLTASLDTRGQQKLDENSFTTFMSLQPLAYSTLQLGTDYNVGDRVTVQQFGVSVDLLITSGQEDWSAGNYNVTLGFDKASPSITSQAQGTAISLQKALATINPTLNTTIDGTLAGNSDSLLPTEKAVKTYADTKQPSLGFTPENVANKSIDGTLASNNDTLYPSQKAVKTYADTRDNVFAIPIKPLTGTISANTTYSSMPTAEGAYRVYIPAAYLVASSGGPYILTLSNGVGTNGILNILAHGDTLTSGDLFFDVYITAGSNIIIGAYTLSGSNANGKYAMWPDGTLEEWGQTSPESITFTGEGAVFTGRFTGKTFPFAFYATPVFQNRIISPNGGYWTANDTVSATTFRSYVYVDIAVGAQSISFDWHAIGRWRA